MGIPNNDLLIRCNAELVNSRDYIRKNAANWEEERSHPSGLAQWID